MAGLQPGSCVLVAQKSSRVGANAATVRLPPQLALPVSLRTDVHVPGQCGSRGLSGISSTTRAVLHQPPHGHTVFRWPQQFQQGVCPESWFPKICSLPRRKVMTFSSWTLCVLRPDLRVSIRSNFSRVFCPVRKREHPVSITRFPTWCAVITTEIDRE